MTMLRFKILRGLHSHGEKLYGPGQEDGDIIESEIDLADRFGSEKFQQLHKSEPVDEFDGMTIPELQAYAEENEIDIGDARLKKDIAIAVREAAGV